MVRAGYGDIVGAATGRCPFARAQPRCSAGRPRWTSGQAGLERLRTVDIGPTRRRDVRRLARRGRAPRLRSATSSCCSSARLVLLERARADERRCRHRTGAPGRRGRPLPRRRMADDGGRVGRRPPRASRGATIEPGRRWIGRARRDDAGTCTSPGAARGVRRGGRRRRWARRRPRACSASSPWFEVAAAGHRVVLDLGVRRMPEHRRPVRRRRPYYCSVHSPPAALAPGRARPVDRCLRYHRSASTSTRTRSGPSWKPTPPWPGCAPQDVVMSRYLHRMVVTHGLPSGLGGRPGRPARRGGARSPGCLRGRRLGRQRTASWLMRAWRAGRDAGGGRRGAPPRPSAPRVVGT